MKDFVSDHRITVVASTSLLLMGTALVVTPGGSWPGVWSGALAPAVVLGTIALLLTERSRVPAPVPAVRGTGARALRPMPSARKGRVIL